MKRYAGNFPMSRFAGSRDTEVILEHIARFGLWDTVQQLIGMFAFSLWDRHEKSLHLIRDRLGIKPLYWGRSDGVCLFGSELKAVTVHPAFRAGLDRNAIASYLRHNYIPAPHSVYENIHKLQPGCMVTLKKGTEPQVKCYWNLQKIVRAGQSERLAQTDDRQAVAELDALLRDAIGRRMVADVPLGAFLSGGIDSSTVAALMQDQSPNPVRTFSIGFSNQAYNEAQYAAKVAAHLKTDHTELYVDYQQARDVIPRLPALYDEPFADSSQIPTFLVSEMTKRNVTVALSGDGGDEVFAGYNRYIFADNIWKRIGLFPARCANASPPCSVPCRRLTGTGCFAICLRPCNGHRRAISCTSLRLS